MIQVTQKDREKVGDPHAMKRRTEQAVAPHARSKGELRASSLTLTPFRWRRLAKKRVPGATLGEREAGRGQGLGRLGRSLRGWGTQAGADLTVAVVGVAAGPRAAVPGSERLPRPAALSRGCRLPGPLYN